MVSYEEVGEILAREAQERAVGLVAERVATTAAVGRVAWSDVRAECAVPQGDRAIYGGFALVASLTESATSIEPARFRIEGSTVLSEEESNLPTARAVSAGEFLESHEYDAVFSHDEVELEGDIVVVRRPMRVGEGIRPVGGEVAVEEVIVAKGESFSVADVMVASVAGVQEVDVCPRLTLGLVIVGDGPGALLPLYSSVVGLVASEVGVVLSEVVRCAADADEVSAQIERLLGLELDCIVAISGAPEQVRPPAEAHGLWVLFDAPSISPLNQAFFGSFRGRRSVLFSFSEPLISFAASLRFLLVPYVSRVAGCQQRPPVKATLAHLVEGFGDGGAIRLGQLVARRGEFLVTIFPDSDPYSSVQLVHASCWVSLPAGRTLLDRGDLVDVESLLPDFSRRSLIQAPDSRDRQEPS